MNDSWQCILCGGENSSGIPAREGMPCISCDSNWRTRAVLLAVTIGLGIGPRALNGVSPDWSRTGLGISDSVAVSRALYSRFDYTNSQYHRFPLFDVTAPPRELLENPAEFAVCSDVLEHVPTGVDLTFRQIARLIRPGGFVVLSVPTHDGEQNREFYPGLVTGHFEGGSWVWQDAAGTRHVDETPEMHGGEGRTIAFRTFGEVGVVNDLLEAGFSSVATPAAHPQLGVPAIPSPGLYLARRA